MQTLISNLNVIRATRVSGFLCNGIGRMSTAIATLTASLAETSWCALAANHREPREMFWKPLYASAGKPVGIGSEKHSSFSPETDQTCPPQSRLWGQPQMTLFAVDAVSTARPTNATSKFRCTIG